MLIAAFKGVGRHVDYRVVAAPLFAVWNGHPSGPEDVVPTQFGPIHAIVVSRTIETVDATPVGPADSHQPDADLLDSITGHPWGSASLDAIVRPGPCARPLASAGVHHSTMAAHVATITDILGWDPFAGLGRTRLGIAYLMWRLRHSRVLDLPAPTY